MRMNLSDNLYGLLKIVFLKFNLFTLERLLQELREPSSDCSIGKKWFASILNLFEFISLLLEALEASLAVRINIVSMV